MKTSVKIKPDNKWYSLDLFEEIPISVVISQDDITDIGSSSYSFSKTFRLPGTKNNNDIFKGFYSVVGIDFDSLTKIECVVEYGGAIIFEGFLRLNSVIFTGDYIEYEVFILTDIADFSSEIQGLNIADLNYQDLDHENNYDNITKSWEYTGGTSGLFNGQILYPLYNYGLIYDSNDVPSFTFDIDTFLEPAPKSFTDPSNAIPEEYLKPAIQVKSILDRIFDNTSYTYNSDFFNSDYFKSIYMSLSNNGRIGVTREDETTQNRNKFKVYASDTLVYSYDPNEKVKPLVFSTLDPDGYDPLNTFTLDNDFPNASPDNFLNYFSVPTSGDYFFNLRFRYLNAIGFNVPAYFRIQAYKSTTPFDLNNTGTLFYQTPGSGFPALGTSQEANVFFSGALQSNEYVSLYLEFVDTAGFPEAGVRLTGRGGVGFMSWDLYEAPTLQGTTNVDVKLQVPDIDADDFFSALIKMFNLTIQKDDSQKVLRIEPWNTYYNDPDRRQIDWSNKLDTNSSFRVEPLDFELSKEIEWSYLSADDEVLGKFYEDEFNTIFGTKVFTSTSNILTDRQELEIPFRPFPTNSIRNGANIIIGETYQLDDNSLQKAFAGGPHLFFWVGNRYMYADQSLVTEKNWYLTSGATQVELSTYPAVNHLSRLSNISGNDFSDLNFRPYWDFFASNNTFVNPYSRHSLYDAFWVDYINSLYSSEARRLQGRFYLEPSDIGDLKLNDKIFVKDNFWRIEEIKDANLIEGKLTNVSLLKEITGFYDRQPPAPVYDITPNQPYPPAPDVTINWFFENKLGANSGNITFPELFIQRTSNNQIMVDLLNQFGNGSFVINPDVLLIAASFSYRELSQVNNIQITMGTSSGDDSYGILQIPNPEDNLYYELIINQGFNSTGDLYITIDTY